MGHEGIQNSIVDFGKPLDASKLAGKSVIITGGASGLGAQVATELAQHKAHVTIADINEELGQTLVKRLNEERLDINFVCTDVTSWESQVAAFKAAIKYGGSGGIDIVCAIAGLAGVPFIEADEEVPSMDKDPPKPQMVDATYNVNAKGVYFTSKLAQHYFGLKPAAQQNYRNVLIMFGSLCSYLELNAVEYCSTKWAVRGIFRSIRSMMEDMGYRTNLIAPWIMDTPMAHGFAVTCREQGIAVGNVSDVVNAVMRCAADESISGRALAIGAERIFDLEDDLLGLNAGQTMADYHNTAEVKGLMKLQGQRP